MNLTPYRTLGRSGLVVSPFALGTMTFGNKSWGSSDEVSRAIFNAYIEAGGNFIDTADVYSGGRSEELLGSYVAEHKLRDKLVLATKFAFNAEQGNPNAGGNGRKNIHRALEASLRRLKTDYLDLYWLHAWDRVTPAEEVLQTLGDLVRSGQIRYFGFSNIPAWYVAKAATLAAAHNVPGPVALQLGYSLVERNIENEHLPAVNEFGLGLVPWSPLAYGLLTGKYQRGEGGTKDKGRLSGPNPFGDTLFTERNWRILDTLRTVAEGLEHPLAQVALAWLLAQPSVTSPILGARGVEQLQDNLRSLDITLTAEQLRTLNEASTPEAINPYMVFTNEVNQSIFGGAKVQGWR
jgi:aryl-alcohol dehydrogenase-like predicted oxidoreductase